MAKNDDSLKSFDGVIVRRQSSMAAGSSYSTGRTVLIIKLLNGEGFGAKKDAVVFGFCNNTNGTYDKLTAATKGDNVKVWIERDGDTLTVKNVEIDESELVRESAASRDPVK